MTSDSTPAFEIEKEALKTEIETGIQSGVDHLEAKTAKRKDADKYHNTRHLLKQYRKVAYAIQISEADMNVRMEMEHGTRLSTLEVNAELAGVDLSGSKLEGYARTVIRSKNMLQIIDNALNTVRMDPDHGELMYQVLYLTYFSKKKPANREVILSVRCVCESLQIMMMRPLPLRITTESTSMPVTTSPGAFLQGSFVP